MPDKPWKRAERHVAHRLGGRRTNIPGMRGPDVSTQYLAVEVKFRGRLPTWLKVALQDAKRKANKDQTAIAVLMEKGDRNGYALMRLSDLEVIVGALPRKEGD